MSWYSITILERKLLFNGIVGGIKKMVVPGLQKKIWNVHLINQQTPGLFILLHACPTNWTVLLKGNFCLCDSTTWHQEISIKFARNKPVWCSVNLSSEKPEKVKNRSPSCRNQYIQAAKHKCKGCWLAKTLQIFSAWATCKNILGDQESVRALWKVQLVHKTPRGWGSQMEQVWQEAQKMLAWRTLW